MQHRCLHQAAGTLLLSNRALSPTQTHTHTQTSLLHGLHPGPHTHTHMNIQLFHTDHMLAQGRASTRPDIQQKHTIKEETEEREGGEKEGTRLEGGGGGELQRQRESEGEKEVLTEIIPVK